MAASKTVNRVQLWLPVLAYMAAIFYVSSLPDAPLPSGVSDKSGHSMAYAGLGIVVARAFAGGLGRRLSLKGAATAVLLTIAYGVSDEFHQWFVPGRTPEVLDALADAAGALVGTVACWTFGVIPFRGADRSATRDEL